MPHARAFMFAIVGTMFFVLPAAPITKSAGRHAWPACEICSQRKGVVHCACAGCMSAHQYSPCHAGGLLRGACPFEQCDASYLVSHWYTSAVHVCAADCNGRTNTVALQCAKNDALLRLPENSAFMEAPAHTHEDLQATSCPGQPCLKVRLSLPA